MNRSFVACLAHCALAASLVGCGKSGPPAATVSGEVKVNGTPLASGVISFTDAETGGGSSSTADIANGRYEAHTTAGKKRVQISAPVVVGKRRSSPDGPEEDYTNESLPDKYHVKSELTFDAQPGANTKDWSLDVPKKK